MKTSLSRLCANHHFARTAPLFLLAAIVPARAVMFFSTGDPSYNTIPPGGALTNSGWQYEGNWNGFCGTVISSNCFITAKHIGGSVGATFTFQGATYTTTTSYDDPETDLKIWRVSGVFPLYAPLYTRTNEVGQNLVVIGRGTQRGADVRVRRVLKGWQWGTWDSVQRWGQNQVAAVVNAGAGAGELLQAKFDSTGGANEADLSGGDSGGGVFILDGVWKLAGVNYTVSGPYNTSNSGSGFEAALFDEGGLYQQDSNGNWVYVPDRRTDIPGSFFATRVSSRLSWIASIINQP